MTEEAYTYDEEGNIMDSYQGNAYDPASLHRYTYAQNNPQIAITDKEQV